MVGNRNTIEAPKPWEILGAFFGYFAVAKDAPDLFRRLGFTKLIPDSLREKLLEWNKDPNFWLLFLFTILTFAVVIFWLPRKENNVELSDREKHIAEINKIIRRNKVIRILRSLGLVIIREALLDLKGVLVYGTFSRPDEWQRESERAKWIDRITFKGGGGFEYQYSKNFKKLIVRHHPSGSDKYDSPVERDPLLGEIPVLIIASNYFVFWFLLYLIRKFFGLIFWIFAFLRRRF